MRSERIFAVGRDVIWWSSTEYRFSYEKEMWIKCVARNARNTVARKQTKPIHGCRPGSRGFKPHVDSVFVAYNDFSPMLDTRVPSKIGVGHMLSLDLGSAHSLKM
jgi:hypothetical protein